MSLQVTLVALGGSVVLKDRVEIAAAPGRVRGLPDAPTFDHEGFTKALVDRPHRCVVAQVPLAEDAGSVAGAGEDFSNGDFVGIHEGPAKVRVDHTGPVVVSPGEQAGPRRRQTGDT